MIASIIHLTVCPPWINVYQISTQLDGFLLPLSPCPSPSLCAAGHGEMVQRILDILRFLWAIVLAMVDGLTQWLNLLTKQYRETSTVLCNERYFILHKIETVNTEHSSHKTFYFNICLFSQLVSSCPAYKMLNPYQSLTNTVLKYLVLIITDDVCVCLVGSNTQRQTMQMRGRLRAARCPRWRPVWTRLMQKTQPGTRPKF